VAFGGLVAAIVLAPFAYASAATTITSTASVTLTRLTAEASIVCNPGCGETYDPEYSVANIHLNVPGVVIPTGATITSARLQWNFPFTSALGGAALMDFQLNDYSQSGHPPALGSDASLYSQLDGISSGGDGGALYKTTAFDDFYTGSLDLLAAGFGSFIQAGDSVMVNGGAEAANIYPFLNIPDDAWSLDPYVGVNSTSTFRLIVTFPPETADATLLVTYEPAAVPEPAAWALMLIGLGGVGGLLRRRRTPGGLGLT